MPSSRRGFGAHPATAPVGLSRLTGGRDVWIKPDSRYPLSDGLSRVDDATAGSYYTYPGNQPIAEIGQTVQPGFTAELGSVTRDGQRLSPRGAVLTRASVRRVPDFTPRITSGGTLSDAAGTSRRKQARIAAANAPSSPSAPVRMYRLERGSRHVVTESRDRANIVIRVGSFDAARHEERLLDDIVLDEYYGASTDRTGADVTAVTTATIAGGISFDVKANDPSNILRIAVAYASSDAWANTDLTPANPERTRWTGVVPLDAGGGAYLVQAVDGAGNVTTIDEIGRVVRPLAENETPPTSRPTLYLPYGWRER